MADIGGASRDFTRPSTVYDERPHRTRAPELVGRTFLEAGHGEIDAYSLCRWAEDQEKAAVGARMRWWLMDGLGLVARYEQQPIDGQSAHRLMIGLADSGQLDMSFSFYGSDLSGTANNAGFTLDSLEKSKGPILSYIQPPTVVEVPIGNVSEYQVSGFFQRFMAPLF